ncbi:MULTISPECIES: hypothetical protein [unclassified Bradyrhizobium]|uniref:hypothetical protein n=1 Tax=unclassified Bradyrhizobium TaxID=2631580 RepID=UPI003395FBA3
MADLSDQEKSMIWALMEKSEVLRHTRGRFRAIVSDELDKLDIDPGRREIIFEFARQRADNSAALVSDTVELATVEDARRALKDCAARLTSKPWRAAVRDRWPAVIAHEIERLFDEIQGRQFATGGRVDPSVDSALLQLKDAFEVLIKFTTIVLMRGLMEKDRDHSDWARRQLFRRGLSLGHWTGMLRETVTRYNDDELYSAPLELLARASRRTLLAAADEFVTIRNNVIGHGTRSLNPKETAELVVGCLETGKVHNLRGDLIRVTPLTAVLDTMVSEKAYEALAMEAGAPPEFFPLVGAGAAERWLADERHASHDGIMMSTSLRLSDGRTLSLAPFVAARNCAQCGRRDVLLYDSLHDAARGGRFDLLDYARGHKSRLQGAEASDLSEALGDVVPQDAPELVGASTNFGRVLEALDKARVDRNYLSPTYLRDDLADFLRTHDHGVFWLQAPAHVGKTTFVQGLAEAEIGDAPIDPRFEITQGGKCVAYYCRKEYRTGLAGMINTLQDKLQVAYDPSQNLRNEQPQVRPVVETATPRAFLHWLLQWKEFAERYRLAPPGAPLLIAIDGLDEADPPPESTPLQVLPQPSELPKGVYLLLTSRPVGDADAPNFLLTHVETLYGRS